MLEERLGRNLRVGSLVIIHAMWFWIILAPLLVWVALRIWAGYPASGRRYQILNRAEVASVAAFAEAMIPPGGHIDSSGLDADLPAYVDRWMAACQKRTRVLMHLLFFLIEHATLFFPPPGPRPRRRFSSLSLEQRSAALEGWGESGLYVRRLAFVSLRSILTMGYFYYPPVLRQLAVAPYAIDTPVCEADLLYPPIGKLPSDIRYTRDDLSEPSGVPLTDDTPLHPDFAEPTA
jgi:hypothetical protein